MSPKIDAPDDPEHGSCDPMPRKEPVEAPEEAPVPLEIPVEEPIEAPFWITVPAEKGYL